MSSLISILALVFSVLGLLIGVATLWIAIMINRNANNLQIDISGFIIQEITQKITGNVANYVYPYRGKDGKLHKAVEAKVGSSLNLGGTTTAVKNDNN